jgi:hypothetical protein
MLAEEQIQAEAERLISLLRQLSQLPTGPISWNHVPPLLVSCIRLLAHYRNVINEDKKRICIRTLQILCPDDKIDELIPPFVDMVWGLVKASVENEGCRRWCCCCC